MKLIKLLYLMLLVAMSSAAYAETHDQRLEEFFASYWQKSLDNRPEFKTYLGIKDADYSKWNDRSDSQADKNVAFLKQQLAYVKKHVDYSRLSDQNKNSYDFFVYTVTRAIETDKYRKNHYIIDQESSQLSVLFVFLQNNHAIATAADADAFIARLKGLEAVLDQMIVLMRDREQLGVLAPAFAYDPLIEGAHKLIAGYPMDNSGGENPLYKSFRGKISKLSISDADKALYLTKAAAAFNDHIVPAMGRMIAALKHQKSIQKNNNGAWALPDGSAFYEDQIKQYTTLAISADSLHRTGLSEVARIHSEMRAIMKKVGFKGDLQAFFQHLQVVSHNFYPNTDAGRAEFLKASKEQADAVFKKAHLYFNRLPKADFEVRRVEEWRQDSTGIAYYDLPSIDGTRPGIYYVNLRDMKNIKKYPFVSVAYHEGVPGHHFQSALAMEKKGIPMFQKFEWNSAYGEGWALYSEKLAKEMGFFTNPYEDFGRLEEELWRAIRLVVDTGMHAKKWSREKAIKYAKYNSAYTMADVVQEIERFMVWPAQAVSYKVGMLKILELRAKAKKELGAKFNIRDFHSAVLDEGSVPLPLLVKQVDSYIQAALKN